MDGRLINFSILIGAAVTPASYISMLRIAIQYCWLACVGFSMNLVNVNMSQKTITCLPHSF